MARKSSSWLPQAPNTIAGQIQGTEVSSNILVLFVKDSGSGGRGKRIFWKGLVRSSAVLLPLMHQLQRPSGVADIVFQEW